MAKTRIEGVKWRAMIDERHHARSEFVVELIGSTRRCCRLQRDEYLARVPCNFPGRPPVVQDELKNRCLRKDASRSPSDLNETAYFLVATSEFSL